MSPCVYTVTAANADRSLNREATNTIPQYQAMKWHELNTQRKQDAFINYETIVVH